MLLSILDVLECPECGIASRTWKLKGEVTDTRITNGEVICPKDHTWIVKEEILRFDSPNNTGQMEFLDHPRTGFPKSVGERERFDFLDELQELIEHLEFEETDRILVRGNPILFMKYLKSSPGKFIVAYPQEGTLRQLQEIAARKRMYNQMSFIKAEDVGYLGDFRVINIFNNAPIAGTNILLSPEEHGDVKWRGNQVHLSYLEL